MYRAVGYRSAALEGVPFDDSRATIPNDGGRVLDAVKVRTHAVREEAADRPGGGDEPTCPAGDGG